jgi:hypothetical protein
MALRSFLASDGHTWTVWHVQPTRGTQARPGIPAEWLAFQIDDESERRRLRQFPPDWEALSDERLDLLRRMAEVVNKTTGGQTAPSPAHRRDPADPQL